MADRSPLQKIDWTEVESSNVEAVSHSDEHLIVRFKNGSLYSYEGVDEEVFYDLANAESVGKYLARVVKTTYPYQKWESEAELIDYLNKW